MKRGVACITAQYDVNLTDYLHCFTAFDADYDSLNKVNVITKAKNTYQKTEEFLESIKGYPELNHVRMKLKELNKFFAVQLAIKTKDAIKLHEKVDSKTTNRFSLAKLALNDLNGFLESIKQAMKDLKIISTQLATKTLDVKAKLDDVDTKLLQSESIATPFQDKSISGININSKTYRPSMSLFADGYIKSVKTSSGKKEEAILERFDKFLFMVRENNHKIGFIACDAPEIEPANTRTKLSMS